MRQSKVEKSGLNNVKKNVTPKNRNVREVPRCPSAEASPNMNQDPLGKTRDLPCLRYADDPKQRMFFSLLTPIKAFSAQLIIPGLLLSKR